MEHVIVNAVGQQCPIPVVMASNALKALTVPSIVEVHVDNEIAVQNLTRLAGSYGLLVKSERREDKLFVVQMEVEDLAKIAGAPQPDTACGVDARRDFVVAVESSEMGRGEEALGKTLMKGFLYAVSQLEQLPAAILFYNGGAFLTCEGSDSLEDLKSMEAQGVEIWTCGTCLDFYHLQDKLAVGKVTNMYSIVEKLAAAGKVIKP